MNNAVKKISAPDMARAEHAPTRKRFRDALPVELRMNSDNGEEPPLLLLADPAGPNGSSEEMQFAEELPDGSHGMRRPTEQAPELWRRPQAGR